MASEDTIDDVLQRSNFGVYRQSLECFRQYRDSLSTISSDKSKLVDLETTHRGRERSYVRRDTLSDNCFQNRDSFPTTGYGTEMLLPSDTSESASFLATNYDDLTTSSEITLTGVDSKYALDLGRDLATITKNVEVFSKASECLEFIGKCKTKSVFLVWVGEWSKEIELEICAYYQIISIYVLRDQSLNHVSFGRENHEGKLFLFISSKFRSIAVLLSSQKRWKEKN